MKAQKSKKFWMLALLILLGGGLGFWRYQQAKKTAVVFETVMPLRQTITLNVNATGVIEPQNRLEIKPPISGRIESLLVVEGQRVKKGQILAWMSSVERAALLDAARAQGDASFARWQEIYKPAPIVAPMDGTVIARHAENGQTVTTQDVPLVMSDRLIVKAQVDETDIGKIKLGQKALIVPDAYADKQVEGKVVHIAFEAVTVNNVTIYEVEILPETVPEFMRSGMTVNVVVEIETKQDVLALPSSVIQEKNGRHFVRKMVSQQDQDPQKQNIEIGLSDGKYTEIVSGLSEQDRVVEKTTAFEKNKKRAQNNPLSPFGNRKKR